MSAEQYAEKVLCRDLDEPPPFPTARPRRHISESRQTFLWELELYRARPDKSYSLTDCISMQTMRREGLTHVLTNERHFEQDEGFRAIFREPEADSRDRRVTGLPRRRYLFSGPFAYKQIPIKLV